MKTCLVCLHLRTWEHKLNYTDCPIDGCEVDNLVTTWESLHSVVDKNAFLGAGAGLSVFFLFGGFLICFLGCLDVTPLNDE